MKFKIDENLPLEVADDLRAAGHDAQTVFDEGLAGAADPAIMARVKAEGRVLLTMDKGIGNIHHYPPTDYAGIVLFRPRSSGRGETLRFVRHHVPTILAGSLNGHLWVISDAGIRVR
jgi:hypothetical protein